MIDRPLELHTTRCLNTRYKQAACTRCVDACPSAAITLQHMQPALDTSLCTRCGACLNTCPTEVFTQPHAPESTLLQTANQAFGPAIQVACAHHPTPGRLPAACETVLVHSRCLAAISLDQWIELSHDGERAVWLDDTACMDCALAPNHKVLCDGLVAANALLLGFGCQASLHLVSRADMTLQTQPARVTLVDGQQPRLSRRGFFGLFRQLAAETNAVSEATGEPQPSAPDKHLPASRRRLHQRLMSLPQATTNAVDVQLVPYAQVAIEAQSCTACGLCSRVCPTGALVQWSDSSRFQVRFSAASCVDCGLCALACPRVALYFAPTLRAAALLEETPQVLVDGPLVPCQGCGVPTAMRPDVADHGTCHVCLASGPPRRANAPRPRRTLFDQLAASSTHQPQAAHQNGGVANVRPSCISEGVGA